MLALTRAFLWASIVPLLASCTIPREITRTARSAIKVRSCLDATSASAASPVGVVDSALQCAPHVGQRGPYRAVGRMLHGEIGSEPHV